MATPPKIHVFIVDDLVLFRQTLRSLLAPYPDIEVVGESGDVHEALESVGRLKPSVVLMDIHLQRVMDGIAGTRLMRSRYPDVAIVGLSLDTREYVAAAMREAGAFEVLM